MRARRATKIQWTERTWQVTSGCREWSPGCLHCYARLDARRMGANPNEKIARRYRGLVVVQNEHLRWTGEVRELPEQLCVPMRWRGPTTVFVNSLSDLFQQGVSFEYIAAVFGVMAMSARHTFQVLTKRPDRMRAWFAWVADQGRTSGLAPQAVCAVQARAFGVEVSSRDNVDAWPLPNVWIGTSVEDQRRADERLPELLACPAALRFLSVEPLLEEVDLTQWLRTPEAGDPRRAGLWCARCGHAAESHWCEEGDDDSCLACEGCDAFVSPPIQCVIVGGESGPDARPCDLRWGRRIVRHCREQHVLVFVKQLGRVVHGDAGQRIRLRHSKGGDTIEWPEDLRVQEFPARVP